MVRKSMRKTKKNHMRGGESGVMRPHSPTSEAIEHTMVGGRKHRKSHKKYRGGSMLATALLPFGLFGLQKFFQKSRKTQRTIKRVGRSAQRTVKRIL
jgi:hypothetical protein